MNATQCSGVVGRACAAAIGVIALIVGLLGGGAGEAAAVPTGNVVVDPTFQPPGGFGGRVQASAVQADGKVLVAGSFAMVNDAQRTNLARLNADGTLDPTFAATTDGPVQALVVQADGKVVVAGSFTQVNGSQRGGVARLHPNGDTDLAFDSGVGVMDDPSKSVMAVVVQPDGAVVIGGRFDSVQGVAVGNFARLGPDGAVDTAFSAGGGFSNVVHALLLQPDGAVVAGGNFHEYQGVPRRGIARVLPNGALDHTFEPGQGIATWSEGAGVMPGTTLVLAGQPDGRIVVGGRFDLVDGNPMRGLARLNADGSVDATFNVGAGFGFDGFPAVLGSVATVELAADGSMLVGGDFTTYGGTPRARIAKLQSNGSLDGTFDPGAGFPGAPFTTGVDTISGLADGSAVVGGLFATYDGQARNALLKVGATGTADATFTPVVAQATGFTDAVTSVAVTPDGQIIAGGWFGAFNDFPLAGVAKLNADGSLVESFRPQVTPGNTLVNAVALQGDGKVLIAGGFTAVDGEARGQIARLNPDGSLDLTFDPGAGFAGGQNGVNALLLQPDGKIVAGGDFATFAGAPRSGVARLNADGSLDTTFDPGAGILGEFGSGVGALARQPDGKIIAAGRFSVYDGWPTWNLARINADGSVDTSLNGIFGISRFAVAVGPDGKPVVAGDDVRRFLASGSPDTTFAAPAFTGLLGSPAFIRSVVVLSDNSVLVGGAFSAVGGVPRSGIARLLPNGALDESFDPGSGFGRIQAVGAVHGVTSMVAMPDGRIVVGGGFVGFNDAFVPPANITRLQPVVVAPGMPTNLSVTNADTAALVTFTSPANHGGAPVVNYEYSIDGGAWTAQVPASAEPAVRIAGLTNDTLYQVRLRAVNVAGPGTPSAEAAMRPTAAPASVFVPVEPARVVDSRVAFGGEGPILAGSSRVVSLAEPIGGGTPVVPAGAVAVAYNLTVPNAGGAGHVRVMPGDAVGLSSASAINFRAGETIANAATVKVAPDRTVKLYAGATVDVVIDVTGYFVPAALPAAENEAPEVVAPAMPQVVPTDGVGSLFNAVPPVRVYDSAEDAAGPLAAKADRLVSVAATQDGGQPVVPAGASAVAYNVTVAGTVSGGHVRVMPGDVSVTSTSVLNWSVAGERIANGAVVGVDQLRQIRVFNGSGAPVRFLVDVVGYYADTGRQFYPVDSVRTTDTRLAFGGSGPVASGLAGAQAMSVAASNVGGLAVVPDSASAVAYNATVVRTGSLGHLRAYPADGPLASASTLNWPGAGYTRANASLVGISPQRQVTIYNGSTTPTDVLIDIQGYYR